MNVQKIFGRLTRNNLHYMHDIAVREEEGTTEEQCINSLTNMGIW